MDAMAFELTQFLSAFHSPALSTALLLGGSLTYSLISFALSLRSAEVCLSQSLSAEDSSVPLLPEMS